MADDKNQERKKPTIPERIFGPVTLAKLKRFKRIRRAYWSFWILLTLFCLSLVAELFCNAKPLYVRFNGSSYFPFLKFHSEDEFLDNGINNRADYKELARKPVFAENDENYMLWPLIPYGPYETLSKRDIDLPNQVKAEFIPRPKLGYLDIRQDLSVRKAVSVELFFGENERELRNKDVTEFWEMPAEIKAGLQKRFADESSPEITVRVNLNGRPVDAILSEYESRGRARKKHRVNLQEVVDETKSKFTIMFGPKLNAIEGATEKWQNMSEQARQKAGELIRKRFDEVIPSSEILLDERNYLLTVTKEEVTFPFRPVKGHWLGLDESGRDVLVITIYAFRINMLFGLLLVLFSKVLGVFVGAVQGYYGGIIDIGVQRFTEIWAALPFLYIMILIGSIYGRGFFILLFIYCIFHWIGISYYMRAEFLRLRRLPFVEAAKVVGLPTWKIISRHILPNALVPLITFTPFSLVGAIGILSALDYLGFGLPPLTPSWGTLLYQAQQYPYAWWLTLFPALALFITMLLGVFIGEGVRAAFDPKKFSRMK